MKNFNVFLLIAVTAITIMSGCSTQSGNEIEKTSNKTLISTTEVTSEKKANPLVTTIASETKATTAKTTAAETTTTPSKVSWANESDMLGDDLYDYQFLINGEFYSLPITMEDLMAKGWKPYSYDESSFNDVILPYHIYWGFYRLEKDGTVICADVFNTNIDAVKVPECFVYELSVDTFVCEMPEITMPGGIKNGVSSIADVETQYGKPTSISEVNDEKTIYYYEQDTYNRIEISFQNGVVDDIGMANLVYDEPDTNVDTSANDEKVKNELLSKYNAPEALSSKMSDLTFMLGEKAYVLPAPMQTFIENGWEISEEDSKKNLLPGDIMTVELFLGNREQTIDVWIRNSSDYCVSVDCCEVIEVSNRYNAATKLELPYGIFIGADENTFLSVIENTGYEIDEGYSSIYYYWYFENGYASVCVEDEHVKNITLKMS